MEKSTYKNSVGETVTLYKNTKGYMGTIVNGSISLYTPNGDLMCGAKDEVSVIKLLTEWDNE